jgi:hypothetical protein
MQANLTSLVGEVLKKCFKFGGADIVEGIRNSGSIF